MKVIEPGHVYELSSLDGELHQLLTFVNREDFPHPGTQTQDVIRCLIDRTQHCNRCLPWDGNDQIIHHLRMALVFHEARALIRKTEKKYIEPEVVATAEDGHFLLSHRGNVECRQNNLTVPQSGGH